MDLAVGVVIGGAFGAVVTALVSDFLTPFISAVARIPDMSGLTFTINGSVFRYGHFLNALISFVLVAAAIFFFVMKPVNMLVSRAHKEPPADPTIKKCPECLSEIPIDAKRCKFCTQQV
jgi:large conductance mechanosensitive channel